MTKKQEVALREMPQLGFHFNEEVHLYVLDGKPLTGVTTILGVIAKPNLIQWAANLAAAEAFKIGTIPGLREAIMVYPKIDTEAAQALDKLFPEFKIARTAHNKTKVAAASMGTDAHAVVEEIVKDAIRNWQGKIQYEVNWSNPDPIVDKIVKQFVQWAKDSDITFLESEKRLYSRNYWYAGTCDLVFMQGGKKRIGDIKTSSGIYGREYFAQMAGYQVALEEQGVIQPSEIEARTVVRCGKDGSFEVKDSFDYDTDKQIFLAAVSLYRGLETF